MRAPFRVPFRASARGAPRPPWWGGGEQKPEDFPSLMAWWPFDEGAGTALGDWLYAMTGGVRGVGNLIATVGSADAWAVPGAFTATHGASPTYARSQTVAPLALRSLGTKSLIVEMDVNVSAGSPTGVLVTCGRGTSQTNQGWELGWLSSGRVGFKAAGATAAAAAINFGSTPAGIAGSRTHIAVVWDRDANDTTGELQLWVGGGLVDRLEMFATDPGSILAPSTAVNVGAIGVGADLAATPPTAGDVSADFHNVRIWYPSVLPDNFAAAMSQAAERPDRIPDLFKGMQ